MVNKSSMISRLHFAMRVIKVVSISIALLPLSNAQQAAARIVSLKTRDIQINLASTDRAPRLLSLSQGPANTWRNKLAEILPGSVEIGGIETPVNWRLRPGLCRTNKNQVVFVYESTEPHLLLSWIWEVRAAFGPIEHRISIQNLSTKEIWVPMVDSLRFAFSVPAQEELRNFYVEKGADTPSAQGTHLDDVGQGYDWAGKSSTYAYPVRGESREIIPIEIVFQPTGSQAGWFAGIEFSGRSRISLERTNAALNSVLGLNPDPGPFHTRLAPGGVFETPTIFLGAFSGGPDGAGTKLRPVDSDPLATDETTTPCKANEGRARCCHGCRVHPPKLRDALVVWIQAARSHISSTFRRHSASKRRDERI